MPTRSKEWPLTEAQLGLWYAQQLDPDNPLFNTGFYADLHGRLDRERFKAAVDRTLNEADTLCLVVGETPNGPRQWLDETRRPALEIVDVSDKADPRMEALAAIERDIDIPVNPVRSPLATEKLFILGADRHVWYRRVHHLAIDGYGMTLLNTRIAALYNSSGHDAQAVSPLAPFEAVLDEDAAYRDSERRIKDAAYWRDHLADLPQDPGMVPGRAVSAHRFDRARLTFDAPLMAQLQLRAGELNISWPDLVTALTAAYCRRFAGTAEIVAGVPVMGRFGSASARVPSMVMNVLPLRVTLDETGSIADFLASVSRSLVIARRHGRYRSEQMRRDLGLLGGHRRLYGPLINVLPFDLPPRLADVETTVHALSTGPVDDITFTFRGDGKTEVTLEVDTNPDLYSREQGTGHAERLIHFLKEALQATTLADVPTATSFEAHHFIETVNQTDHPLPRTTLAALLEEGLARTPHATALIVDDGSWSYGELEKRTRALALQLREKDIGPEAIVAVALPRSPELVIALLAIVRAGAAYLPLDPSHPPERIARILASAQANLVLSTPDIVSILPPGTSILATPDWAMEPAAATLADTGLSPENLAYVIYTSGSTGEPKGVMIEHGSIVNRLEWMRQHYRFSGSDRILQKTPATFDVSVWEFFLPFISGASLAIAPPEAHRDPKAIAALIRDHAVTTVHFVPSMLAAFLDEPTAKGLKLRRVFCSGEELPADLCVRFHDSIEAELHNLYGPTEAAVDVSYWPVGIGDRDRPVPIGLPVWNSRLYILDERKRPLPAGVAGDLYLAGTQIARGYLGRPDLTDERFVSDPFVPGARMYRTGDLARWREDGAAIYLGRSDSQVKIRGIRIELGEIETVIMASGLTRQAAVIAREDKAGHKRLVAYLVPHPHFDETGLRAYLRELLLDYQIPAAFVTLDALPTTANGKLDRSALPPPEFAETPGGRAAATLTERRLAALFAEILDLHEPPSADGDFFILGGDSLLAVTLMLRIEEIWGRDPGLGALFDRPDLAGLAALIDADAPTFDNGLQPVLRLASGSERLAPIFLIHPVGGIAWCYRHLARMLSPRRSVYGLQAPALSPGTAPPHDLEALADDYAARLLSISPHGPHHIAGWSVGGIIAQAVAVRLKDLGHEIGVVALFDSYPSDCWRAEAEPTPTEALRALLAVAGYMPEHHPELQSREQILAFLKAGDNPLGALPGEALDGVIRVVLDVNRLVRGHFHRHFSGKLTHFRAALDHLESGLHPALWQPYADEVDIVDLPFQHPQMTTPDASVMIAKALDDRFDSKENYRD